MTAATDHHIAVKTEHAASMLKAYRINTPMSIMEIAARMQEIGEDNLRMIDNRPEFCGDCGSMLLADGRCPSPAKHNGGVE